VRATTGATVPLHAFSSLLAGPAELLVRGVEELGVFGLGEAVAPVGSVLRPVRVR